MDKVNVSNFDHRRIVPLNASEEFRSLGFTLGGASFRGDVHEPVAMALRRLPDGSFVAFSGLEIERIVIQPREPDALRKEGPSTHEMWSNAANAISRLAEKRELWYVLATRLEPGVDGSTLRTGWLAVGRGGDPLEASLECERTLDLLRTIQGGFLDFLVTAPVIEPATLLDLVRPVAAPFVRSLRRLPTRTHLFVSSSVDEDGVQGILRPWSGETASWLPLAEGLAACTAHAALVVRVTAGMPVPPGLLQAAERDFDQIGRRYQEVLDTPVRELTLVPKGFEALLQTATRRLGTLKGPCLAVDVSLATSHEPAAGLEAILMSSLTATPDRTRTLEATSDPDPAPLEIVRIHPGDLLASLDPESHPELLIGRDEAATLVRTVDPPRDERSPLPCSRARLLSLRQSPRSGTLLGTSEGRGTAQQVRLDEDARFQHVYIVGQTGTGKSTLMLTLALGDIAAGHGITVLDPHGSLIDAILERIPPNRAGDVTLMSPGVSDRYVGLNPLDFQTHDPDEYLSRRDHMIDELLDTFNAFYNMREAGGPMFEQYFRVFVGLVCGTKPPEDYIPVLPMVALAMQNPAQIRLLASRLGTADPITSVLIKGMMETSGEQSFPNFGPYVTSKLNRFYASSAARRVLCQSNTIEYERVIRDRRILLVNLHKGHLGTETAALMARQIVSGLTNAALRRGPDASEAHFIYADEFHAFATEKFAMLMSEARKFRLGLVLAHQYTSQLKVRGDQTVLDAVLGNVGTVIAFRVGANDADLLGGVMAPRVTPADITGLPNYSACVRSVGALGNIPFVLRTTSPQDASQEGRAQANALREHGLTASEADAAIAENLEAFRTLGEDSGAKVVALDRHHNVN